MMKKDLYISLAALIIFSTFNLIGGIINDVKGSIYNTHHFFESIPFHLIFCLLFWMTCIPGIIIRKTLRLPIIRTIFWLLICINIWTGDSMNQIKTIDLADAAIPPFCFFISIIGSISYKIDCLNNLSFRLFGILILGVSFYQIIVLELATIIINKLQSKAFKI
jgi:hypothetical protein